MNRMRWWLRAQRALGVLYPARCPLCDGLLKPEESVYFAFGKEESGADRKSRREIKKYPGIHGACLQRLTLVQTPVCMRCGRPLSSREQEYCADCGKSIRSRKKERGEGDGFRQGKSLFLYKGAVREMMYRFKYQNRREYGDFFARTAAEIHREWLEKIKPQVIIPVPMYGPKRRRRGYDQAEVFARELSRWTGIPCDLRCVRRIRNTKPMKRLDDIQRKNNLKNAFQIARKGIKYKRVLLVDDIYTTGSTAAAVTKVLKEAGAGEVYMMSISIGKGF